MSDLSPKARIFILLIIVIGFGLSVFNLFHVEWQNPWLLVLAGMAAIAQVYKTEGATHKSSYNLAWVIYGGSFIFLGGPSTLFIILAAHLVDWIWHKYPWYIQMYNMATFAIAISATTLLFNWIQTFPIPLGIQNTLAILAAMTAFTTLNHMQIGLAIWFARGQNLAQSGVFSLLTMMIDLTLLGIGVIASLIWTINPSMVLIVIIPIFLIYKTLQVPSLQRQTEIDPKTKLYNAVYFAEALENEHDRAMRFDRPLTVAIGDLDLLRNINNTYGHLAGDVVLVKVAEILQSQFHEYDLVARFGGEEFAILMPETTPEEAFPRVESVRQAIAAAEIEVSTSDAPIKASISFGIAARDSEISPDDIVHNADLALYRSKMEGRNVTRIYSSDSKDEISVNVQPEKNELPIHSTDQHLPAAQPMIQARILPRNHPAVHSTALPAQLLAAANEDPVPGWDRLGARPRQDRSPAS